MTARVEYFLVRQMEQVLFHVTFKTAEELWLKSDVLGTFLSFT